MLINEPEIDLSESFHTFGNTAFYQYVKRTPRGSF